MVESYYRVEWFRRSASYSSEMECRECETLAEALRLAESLDRQSGNRCVSVECRQTDDQWRTVKTWQVDWRSACGR